MAVVPVAAGAILRRMSRGQRYILRRILAATVALAGAFSVIAWSVFGLRLLDKVASGALDAATFGLLSILPLVGALPALLPVSHLAAAVLVLRRLQLDGEATALRAAGLGQGGLAMPVVASGGVVAVVVAAVSFAAAPWAADEARQLRAGLRAGLGLALIETGRFQQIAPGVTLFVAGRTEQGELTGLMIEDARPGAAQTIYVAARARADSGDSGLRLTLIAGTRQERDESGRVTTLSFDRLTLSPRAELLRDRAATVAPASKTARLFELLRRAIAPFATLAGAVLVAAGLLGGAPLPGAVRARTIGVGGLGFCFLSVALLCAARPQATATIAGLGLSAATIVAALVFSGGTRNRRAAG